MKGLLKLLIVDTLRYLANYLASNERNRKNGS